MYLSLETTYYIQLYVIPPTLLVYTDSKWLCCMSDEMLKWHDHLQCRKYPPLCVLSQFDTLVANIICGSVLRHNIPVMQLLPLWHFIIWRETVLRGESVAMVEMAAPKCCSASLTDPWPYFPSGWHLISTVYFCAEPRSKVEAWALRVGPQRTTARSLTTRCRDSRTRESWVKWSHSTA